MPDFLSFPQMPHVALMTALLCFAAWRDILTRTIPDTVSVALVVIGVISRFSDGWEAVAISVGVGLIVFVALLPLCSLGLLGGADLKLLAALSMGLAPLVSLHLVAAVTIVGGGLAAVYLVLNRIASGAHVRIGPTKRSDLLLHRVASVELWRIRRGAPLPYGIAIAIGAVFVVIGQKGA